MSREVIEAPDYRLELHFEAPLLRVRVSGGEDTGLVVTRAYWLRMLEAAGARGATQLLVVDAMQGEVMDDGDLLRFFDAVQGKGLDAMRVAYVEGRADQIPRMEHAELMARERGYDARIFNDEAEATLWLRHGMR